MTRSDRDGIGAGPIRDLCAQEHSTASALASAVQSAASGKAETKAAETRAARPNDGTEGKGKGTEGTEVTLTPAQEVQALLLAAVKIVRAEGKGWALSDSDAPAIGKSRTAVDTIARALDGFSTRLTTPAETPAPEVATV
jgi:hypothetical protein